MNYYVKKLLKILNYQKKGKADIPNYFQYIYDSMNIFYHQTINYFPESDSYK